MKDTFRSIEDAVGGGANGCYIHGGFVDFLFANGQLDIIPRALEKIKESGLAAGIAGHNPEIFRWAEKNIDVDFYMCSYYNPVPRDKNAELSKGTHELFRDEDREAMTGTIKSLSKPVIHYKILAAGRNNPSDAFKYATGHMRKTDAVCVGVYTKNNPGMLKEDINLLMENLKD
jgi:hypothetical protein